MKKRIVIIGIIMASPIALLGNLNFMGISFVGVLLMCVCLAIGFIVSMLLGEKN